MADDFDAGAFKNWTPAAQERALQALRERTAKPWRPFFCPNPTCDGSPHNDWDFNHARADQRPPTDSDWLTWLLMSGRGTGKTRTGSEFIHRAARKLPRIGLIAATAPDARDIMLEGESGLLTIAAPDFRPFYEPSKKRLTWPNGTVGHIYSAEEPDRLRGPEHYLVWADEPAHWPLVQECWDNMLFGLRLGARPRIIATTTPKTRPWLKELLADPATRTVSVSTYMNLANLSPVFAERVIKKYEGTRLGRQELHGEMLTDVEGAMWTWEMIEEHRSPVPADFDRIVVSIDPAGSQNRKSDETGIICSGAIGEESFVLGDASGKYSPHGWAKAAERLYEQWDADAIIVERNFGGDMVANTLRAAGIKARVIETNSSRGKQLRAEPIVGLYEQGKVHHTQVFEDLEAQMTEWVPADSRDSPDRVDALVFTITELQKRRSKATVSSPVHLKRVV
jgi:phage terminase large subunit-like protein